MTSEDIWVIVGLIAVFYLCRELNCWYLKINDRKKQMDQMIENQKEIITLLKKDEEKRIFQKELYSENNNTQ